MSKLQKTFDKVARHLLTQKQKAGRPRLAPDEEAFVCLYRDKKGRRCAVGCLIPDEMYNSEMEGLPATRLLDRFPELRQVPEINSFGHELYLLQRIHDGRKPEEWRDALAEFAIQWHLDRDVLQEFK